MPKDFYYFPYPMEVAGKQYVREVTRWPGHKKVVNIPVEYE